jgi:predicted CoA-substrate-specific enzyme activase
MIAPRNPSDQCWIGLDVGSTAVKAVVVDAADGTIRDRRYLRHGTRQADGALKLIRQLAAADPDLLSNSYLFFTGSGGRALAGFADCRYVQEVNAVALATERLYPEAGSVVDIGGQDAKIIIWQRDPTTGRRRKIFSMNDKCAGGTGSVIDRIAKKLALATDDLASLRTDGHSIHPVAARCGVFAETDINSLQKQGVPPVELLASLFEAIVQQNLSVLTRGATLQPPLLLLGGPHAFLPGLVDAWRRAVTAIWRERRVALPENSTPGDLVLVPREACYFPSLGAVYYGAELDLSHTPSADEAIAKLEQHLTLAHSEGGEPPLLSGPEEREQIARVCRQAKPIGFPDITSIGKESNDLLDVVIGLDAGSTSTKSVLLSPDGTLYAKAYHLSGGDPLDDTRAVMSELKTTAADAGWRLNVRGLGVTGYAKDLLSEFLGADLMLVETVAHTRSALEQDPDADVIVDIGGQDIKVMVLREGRVRDFRLNSQCSAGNGYFLQSTANRFDIPLTEFADVAFSAKRSPRFNVGCAVFLESDIVNFQQIGWKPEEILAGLVRVLPRNVWLYVVGEPNLERLGRRYILQGGTQRNEAAVKAQIDFIEKRVPGATVKVHPHTGESGAIGVALETITRGLPAVSQWLGFDALESLQVVSRQDESIRCRCCANRCQRTLLEATTATGEHRSFMIAGCDTGRRQKPFESRQHSNGMPIVTAPDFAAREATAAFKRNEQIAIGLARETTLADRFGKVPGLRRRHHKRQLRDRIRIGIPRALNLYQTAPYFTAYFQALGIDGSRIFFSGSSTEKLFRRGVRRGAIDNCYPSKLALAHVHDLLERSPLDWIFFPILVNLPSHVSDGIDAMVCPSAQATPEVIKAAFNRERDEFAAAGVEFVTPVFNMNEPVLFARQMAKVWGRRLGITRRENEAAMAAADVAAEAALSALRIPALNEIRRLERDGEVGIVVLGRPYHNDPGLNHRIFQDLNRRGYPIFSINALPTDSVFLSQLFGEEIAQGKQSDPFAIGDVWKHTFSANSNSKLLAAKIVARHPNLVGLDVSSFRCGHDAPISATIEKILETSRTPYFTFHEIDENRASGAIRLRVETIDYFLKVYQQERLQDLETPLSTRHRTTRIPQEAIR